MECFSLCVCVCVNCSHQASLVSSGSECWSSGRGRPSDGSAEEQNKKTHQFYGLQEANKSCNHSEDFWRLNFNSVWLRFLNLKAVLTPVHHPESLWLQRSTHSESLPSSSWKQDTVSQKVPHLQNEKRITEESLYKLSLTDWAKRKMQDCQILAVLKSSVEIQNEMSIWREEDF